MAHALSLGRPIRLRVDQGGLLDLMLLFLAGWSASAPWDSLLALVGSVVGSRVPSLQLCAAYKGAGGAGRRPLVLKRGPRVEGAQVHPSLEDFAKWGGHR